MTGDGPSAAPPLAVRTLQPVSATKVPWLLGTLAVVMALLKLCCAWTTIGTNDVLVFQLFARSLAVDDICALYHQTIYFNHTPLVASYITLINSLVNDGLLAFAFWLRVPGILADFVVALLLISQRRQPLLKACPDWALGLYIASPVSFMVSGFHGNFDSVMVMFMVFSVWMCLRGLPAASALFLGLSLQIKVAPMIVVPVFLIFWLRQGKLLNFLGVLVLTCLVGWIEPLTHDPAVFARNVFGYSGYWGAWGISYWMEHTTWHNATFRIVLTQVLKAGIMLGITWLAWSQRPFKVQRLLPVLAVAWSIFFFFSPAGAPQYMVWLAVFVLLARPRWYVGLTIGSTLFCFFFYHSTNSTWPWYFAKSGPQQTNIWTAWMLLAWVGSGYGVYMLARVGRTFIDGEDYPSQPVESRPGIVAP